jgi:hypothetical protein
VLARTLLAIGNGIAFAAAIAVEVWNPVVGAYLFYALLGWFLACLPISRMSIMERKFEVGLGAPAAAGAGASSSEPPGVSGVSMVHMGPTESFGFCIFCATPLATGARLCPACGRKARPLPSA